MTDDLVIGLRKRRDQGSKMAAARIEADAATIVRLEGERDALRNWRAEAGAEYRARQAAEAKVAALVEALTLAANRLQRCAVDYDAGSRKFIETGEWAEEARAAIAAAKENKDA